MALGGSPAGPRGFTVLAATAVVGIVLAVHGWSGRHPAAPGALSGGASRPSAGVTSPPVAGPPTAGPTAASSSAATGPGPLLSSQSYAAYSFLVWPGTPSAAAQAALTGLSISVRRKPGGISVTANVNGQPAGPAHFYPRGAKVYIVEASMGDDSGSSDYNLGDDGLIVTDAAGRIVQ